MKILIFRIGSLGDNLVAIPSIYAIKDRFPKANLYLLGNNPSGSSRVLGRDIFEGSGLFSGYLQYPVTSGFWGSFLRPFHMLYLLARLKLMKFDLLVYLAPSVRQRFQIERDRHFFNLAGIWKFIGMDGFKAFPTQDKDGTLPQISYEADLLLERLSASNIPVPPKGEGFMELPFNDDEPKNLRNILSALPSDNGRTWIGIGPGSNQPVKIWPKERYEEVVAALIREKDLWPIVLGGPEDKSLGDELIQYWGRGYNFAGLLPVRLAALTLQKCRLYLGNDTGTMHLAALMKIPCVAIFSSHSYPGKWFPYGQGHKVFYQQIVCAGCGLSKCVERKMECILSIQPKEVVQACLFILRNT